MMRPCRKCLENRWTFELIEREVFATCQGCGSEVSWVPKKYRSNRPQKPIPVPLNAYLHQDPGDDGIPPWD